MKSPSRLPQSIAFYLYRDSNSSRWTRYDFTNGSARYERMRDRTCRTAVKPHPEENKQFHLGRMLDTAIDTMLKDRFQASQLMIWRPTEEAIERLRR